MVKGLAKPRSILGNLVALGIIFYIGLGPFKANGQTNRKPLGIDQDQLKLCLNAAAYAYALQDSLMGQTIPLNQFIQQCTFALDPKPIGVNHKSATLPTIEVLQPDHLIGLTIAQGNGLGTYPDLDFGGYKYNSHYNAHDAQSLLAVLGAGHSQPQTGLVGITWQKAAQLADGDGLAGAVFMAALVATKGKAEVRLKTALGLLPQGCQYREVVQDILKWHSEAPRSPNFGYAKLLARWAPVSTNPFTVNKPAYLTDAAYNAGLICLALMYVESAPDSMYAGRTTKPLTRCIWFLNGKHGASRANAWILGLLLPDQYPTTASTAGLQEKLIKIPVLEGKPLPIAVPKVPTYRKPNQGILKIEKEVTGSVVKLKILSYPAIKQAIINWGDGHYDVLATTTTDHRHTYNKAVAAEIIVYAELTDGELQKQFFKVWLQDKNAWLNNTAVQSVNDSTLKFDLIGGKALQLLNGPDSVTINQSGLYKKKWPHLPSVIKAGPTVVSVLSPARVARVASVNGPSPLVLSQLKPYHEHTALRIGYSKLGLHIMYNGPDAVREVSLQATAADKPLNLYLPLDLRVIAQPGSTQTLNQKKANTEVISFQHDGANNVMTLPWQYLSFLKERPGKGTTFNLQVRLLLANGQSIWLFNPVGYPEIDPLVLGQVVLN